MELKTFLLLATLGHEVAAVPAGQIPASSSTRGPSRLIGRQELDVPRPRPTDIEIIENPVLTNWQTKTCTDPGVTDASMPSKERWDLLEADWAFNWLMGQWLDTNGKDGPLTFVQWISNKYHGPEGLDCGKILNDACTEIIRCDEVENPAVWFLLNSFSTVHSLAQSARNEMDIARGDIALGSFMETFCPAKGPDMALEIFKSIIDTVLAGAMMGSAFLWNKAITPGKFPDLTGDNRGYLKDNFNAGITYGFNMAKDNQKGPKDMTAMKTKMEEQMQVYFQEMMGMMEKINEWMFNGEQDSINGLTNAMWDGKLLPNNNIGIDAGSFKEEMKSIVYSQMIPKAWFENPDGGNRPVVLETDDACDGSDRTMTNPAFPSDTADKTRVCLDGVTYYVLNAYAMDPCHNVEVCPDDGKAFFNVLPGGSHDDLNGSRWGKIRLEDIVRSVRDGFVQNGNKNGFQVATEPPTDDLAGFFDSLTWSSPGHWQVPFCPKDRWDDIVRRVAGLDGVDKFWPCGE